ncbi:siroheme synthase [Aureimonas endophytica]|uniref:Siroheme synthase n=1 Tax=Aureimonas endophytica TaxID=2027858 RepID=A0A917A0Q5_9HYPH|nr:siroheme synthase CysG [Aureimonas endophytica]GGE21498.1 siroheme synthase [Aureimonas endophytica]
MSAMGDESEGSENRQRPERMGPLSVVPVFLSLAGRRVIVAGGTAGAAWKAELLAAAGALVEVHAPAADLSDEMAELLSTGAAAGSLCHRDRIWDAACLKGAAVAVLDCEGEGEARAFACAAKAAGVPWNVVDKPAFCQFSFGSVVNRSPVVVGISTDGAAPILGQAIRRRIETLLPPSLSAWGRLAAKLRTEVLERLAPGPQRRAFWERFTDAAFTRRLAAAPETGLEAATNEAEDAARRLVGELAGSGAPGGRVTLVGAGPGEAELLTLKAVRALQSADVILFDDLVSDEVLELARREAKRLLVGKRGGRESCRQEDINATMVRLAKAGRHVVRLKSGDVSVFGRAGEEIAELTREAIPVELVPGITAASALAASFGVSLTHRDHASELRLVTGHSRHGDLPDSVDWAGLAAARATVVFYMGGRMAGRIAARLMGEGLSGDTPVAVAAHLSRADETRRAGRLQDLEAIVAAIGLDKPILIAVGQVFETCLDQDHSSIGIAEAV